MGIKEKRKTLVDEKMGREDSGRYAPQMLVTKHPVRV